VATNSNKVTANNQPETVPSSSMVSKNHPNNNRDNNTDNNKVMGSNSNTVNSPNKDSTVKAATENRQQQLLRVPASHLRGSKATVSSKEATVASRARTKGTASNKVSRAKGTASNKVSRAKGTANKVKITKVVKVTDNNKVARTRDMASSRVKDTVASNKTRVTDSRVAKEVTAREDRIMQTATTRVEGHHTEETANLGMIIREGTVLHLTEEAEDLTVEMTAEAMTTEEVEEMTAEDTEATVAEEAATWTDKVVVTVAEIITEVTTIEEVMTTGREAMIIVEIKATTHMEMIIRATGHKRDQSNQFNKKCRVDRPATPFLSVDCPRTCPVSKLVTSSDKSALLRKTNALES